MVPRRMGPERGASVMRIVVLVVVLVLFLFGAYKIIPWLLQLLQAVFAGFRSWWQAQFGEPIFRLLVYVLLKTRGDVATTLAITACVSFLLNEIFFSIFRLLSFKLARSHTVAQEDVIAQMNDIQGKLRKLFGEDVEKIALFCSGRSKDSRASLTPSYVFFSGCLPMALWCVISWPLMFFIGLAVYDGVVRLFIKPQTAALMLAAAGDHAAEMQPFLPIKTSNSLFGLFTFALTDRNLTLTMILFAVGIVAFLVGSVSKSGWTVPRVTDPVPVIMYVASALLSYIFLDAALLIFAIFYLSCVLIYGCWIKFVYRPIQLRLQSVFGRVKAYLRPSARLP
jgi:hypothetical protein